jgi:hypothetical protein
VPPVCFGRGFLLAPYSPTSVEEDSANFAFTAFSEVRHTQATPSNGKDTPYGGCVYRLMLATAVALVSTGGADESRPFTEGGGKKC